MTEQKVDPNEYRMARKPGKERVFIVGCADSKVEVPFGLPDSEYWGVNNLCGVKFHPAQDNPQFRWDRWFEIHRIEKVNGIFARREQTNFRGQPVPDYVQMLAQAPVDLVYMQQHWDEVPNSVPFPWQEIVKFFGGLRYFTNSISWQIGLAIMLDYKEIAIFGVDMAVGTEYQHQRPSCELLIGIAMGMGRKVTIPDSADLLKTRFMYGIEEPLQHAWQKKVAATQQNMKVRAAKVESEVNRLSIELQQIRGALGGISELNKIWSNLDDPIVQSSS